MNKNIYANRKQSPRRNADYIQPDTFGRKSIPNSAKYSPQTQAFANVPSRKQSTAKFVPDEPDTLRAYPVDRSQQPVQRPVQPRQSIKRPPGPEPICILKIELDGEHVEEIRVHEGD